MCIYLYFYFASVRVFKISLCFTVVITRFLLQKVLPVRNSQVSIEKSKIIVLSNQNSMKIRNCSGKK